MNSSVDIWFTVAVGMTRTFSSSATTRARCSSSRAISSQSMKSSFSTIRNGPAVMRAQLSSSPRRGDTKQVSPMGQ